MPVKVEIKCELSDLQIRKTIDDLAKKNGGLSPIPISSNSVKIDFMDKSQAEAFKKQCEEKGITVTSWQQF
jgi:hypothetical protein